MAGSEWIELNVERLTNSALVTAKASGRKWLAWCEGEPLVLKLYEMTGGQMTPVQIPAEATQPAPLLVAQGPDNGTASDALPLPQSSPVSAPALPAEGQSGASAGGDLQIDEAVKKISEQIGVDPGTLTVHTFATFAVVEHIASGRNWVLAKAPNSQEGWLLASVGPADIPKPQADVCVVEVAQGEVATSPKLLSQLDRPDTEALGPIVGAQVLSADLLQPTDGPWATQSGFVQFGATYHSNVFLTDKGVDFDLVRHQDTDTEISDVIFGPAIGIRLDLNPRLAKNTYFEYIGSADFFGSESGENRWRHSLEFNSRGESGDLIDLWWRGGVIFHDQLKQDKAEYLAQDFMEFWVDPGLDFFLTDKDTLSFSTPLFYRNVAKDGLPSKQVGPPPEPGGGELPDPQGGVNPKSNLEKYADHVGFGFDATWRRRYSQCLESRLRFAYLRRQYDRPYLNEYGAAYGCDTPGCDKEIFPYRQDNLFDASYGFTYAMCPTTAFGLTYRFRSNDSNGPFYDYQEHGLRFAANHTLFHGCWYEANLRLVGDVAWRAYDSRRADTVNTLLLPPTPGPDGILTPGYDESTRKDLTYTARVLFDREFGCYTLGTYYQFEANNSNDGSGDYVDHAVGGYVRMEY